MRASLDLSKDVRILGSTYQFLQSLEHRRPASNISWSGCEMNQHTRWGMDRNSPYLDRGQAGLVTDDSVTPPYRCWNVTPRGQSNLEYVGASIREVQKPQSRAQSQGYGYVRVGRQPTPASRTRSSICLRLIVTGRFNSRSSKTGARVGGMKRVIEALLVSVLDTQQLSVTPIY